MTTSSASRMPLLSTAVLLIGLLCPSCGWAWPLASQPVEGILVLRNGNILRGKVQQQGDRYHVHLLNGQLQVRASQVETFCLTLEQAYQHRCETRGGASADSHLELAGWCLRHDLVDHADAELRAARATDPDHPRLGLLQRQLKQSLQLAARDKKQQVEASKPAKPVEPLDPARLEKAPQWARALFVRQIQPLVVHSCATSGCHQTDSTGSFRLNRLALDGAGHPEATLRNLAATLEQIDWQVSAESDLLKHARQAHGSSDASTPMPAHKLQVLRGWIEQLAEADRKENEIKRLPPVVEIAALPVGREPILNPPRQAITTPPDASRLRADPVDRVRQASFEPGDPFDPSVFNRRYATTGAEQPRIAENSDLRIIETSPPHVLAPTESALTPAPTAE